TWPWACAAPGYPRRSRAPWSSTGIMGDSQGCCQGATMTDESVGVVGCAASNFADAASNVKRLALSFLLVLSPSLSSPSAFEMTQIPDKLRGDMPKGKGTIFICLESGSLGVRLSECFWQYLATLFSQEL